MTDRVHGVFDYEGPAGLAIRNGKYQRWPEAIDMLGTQVARRLPPSILEDPPHAVVPIPLHFSQLTRRGFSPPAILFARHVALRLDRPCLTGYLIRHRKTQEQAGLNAEARKANVASAFRIRKRILSDDVLIVDDVYTTGATLEAAARVLRRSGVRRIRGLVSAYVDGPRIRMDTSN